MKNLKKIINLVLRFITKIKRRNTVILSRNTRWLTTSVLGLGFVKNNSNDIRRPMSVFSILGGSSTDSDTENTDENTSEGIKEDVSEKPDCVEPKPKSPANQSKAKYAFSPEDMDKLFPYIETIRSERIRAKYSIAHCILHLTGMRVMNLRYVGFKELDDFINKKIMFVRRTKSKNKTKAVFLQVSNMEPIVDIIRKNCLILLEYLKLQPGRFYKPDKDHPDEGMSELSEIFGKLSRSSFVRLMNKQLMSVGNACTPKKRFTTLSHRRWVAISVARQFGILDAKYVLGHASISSTQHYVVDDGDIPRFKNCLIAVRKFKNVTEINRWLKNAESASLGAQVEQLINEDQEAIVDESDLEYDEVPLDDSDEPVKETDGGI